MINTQQILNFLHNNQLRIEKRGVFGFTLIECYLLQTSVPGKLVLCIEQHHSGRYIIRNGQRLCVIQAQTPAELDAKILSLIQTIEQHYNKQEAEKDKKYAEYIKKRQELLKQIEKLDKEWNQSY